jgi:hypothetical protein
MFRDGKRQAGAADFFAMRADDARTSASENDPAHRGTCIVLDGFPLWQKPLV